MTHQILLRSLVHDIMPRLQATEKLVNNTLNAIIKAARDPAVREKRQQQKDTFALELYRIRLNLQPLLEQHADAVGSVRGNADAPAGGRYVTLDEYQYDALRAVHRLYEQVRLLSRPDDGKGRETPP